MIFFHLTSSGDKCFSGRCLLLKETTPCLVEQLYVSLFSFSNSAWLKNIQRLLFYGCCLSPSFCRVLIIHQEVGQLLRVYQILLEKQTVSMETVPWKLYHGNCSMETVPWKFFKLGLDNQITCLFVPTK